MKRIGVIGGLGPLATVKFMELLNNKLNNINEEIEMIVINNPTTPDRTAYILDNSKDNPVNNILDMVKKLEIFECDVIVMPCNTASYFYKEINNNTNILFINIVEETVEFLKNKSVEKIGLLATNGTIESGIYNKLLLDNNIECIVPNKNEQEIISSIIYNGIKCGKKVNLNKFYKVANNLLNKGAQYIILGCTELSALKQIENLNDDFLIDAMEILANNTIKYLKIE